MIKTRLSKQLGSSSRYVLWQILCQWLALLGQIIFIFVDSYFSRYLSQFAYAFLAPLTLFAVLVKIDAPASIFLLCAVPLIPIVIMVVMLVADGNGDHVHLGSGSLPVKVKSHSQPEFSRRSASPWPNPPWRPGRPRLPALSRRSCFCPSGR